ncbi:MAG: PFL family protein [Deltaproteobacteria bacterium]|nr:PFL family protein [Deltaproteobacteria bacterium]MBW1951037.1 PFL family protein [Deltaproteobacteria bacterium]MBW2009129.1 PFL family protein [Deltaproteobacteria bacterium]RLB38109.1 MAG: PFL family protein [Deltaproteobacteria bacterium]
MLTQREVLSTLEMLKNEHLDVRTVTLGISLLDCSSHDPGHFMDRVREKIWRLAGHLVDACDEVGEKYGIPVVNKRIAVSPIAVAGAPLSSRDMVEAARTLDESAARVRVDFIGGFSALVEKGMTPGDRALIEAVPEAMAVTERVCTSVNVASTRAGINMGAVYLMGRTLKAAAEKTADADGLGCAKICVFANIPQDIPFMAGAYLGVGEPDAVINVGVSGPGVVRKAIDRARRADPNLDLGRLSEIIKRTAFKVTRVGELIGREVADKLGVDFGVVDLSLAPTPNVGDSVGEIFQSLGLESIGVPGSTAALALINDAVKKGGAFASSYVGGLSGAFIPVSEDLNISKAAETGLLSLEKLEALTSVCSVGLDMVALPGDTTAETLAAVIADEMAIGVINKKTTATRLIPVPGKKAGDRARFGGLLGESVIIPVRDAGGSDAFVRLGGRIPAPIQSLVN